MVRRSERKEKKNVYSLNVHPEKERFTERREKEMKTGQRDEDSPTADETPKPSFIHLFPYLMKALVFLFHLLVLSGPDAPMRGESDV